MTPILGIIASSNFRVPTAYESIATTTVGSGGATDVTFTSIPGTFSHLQIRAIARTNRATTRDALKITVNGNTSTYSYHNLLGTNPVTVQGLTGEPNIGFSDVVGNSASANMFGAMIIDILDYASTTKIKPLRAIGGGDANGSGFAADGSGAYFGNANALTSVKLESYGGSGFIQYTQFALYGIKGV
jgi:hypothetical protein